VDNDGDFLLVAGALDDLRDGEDGVMLPARAPLGQLLVGNVFNTALLQMPDDDEFGALHEDRVFIARAHPGEGRGGGREQDGGGKSGGFQEGHG